MNGFLESPEFQAALKAACQWAFSRYGSGQSTYGTVADLQQDVLLKVIPWLPTYRREANWKTVLSKIARNLLYDAKRKDKAKKREREEVDWEKVSSFIGTSGSEEDFKILFEECLDTLSEQEQYILVQCRLNARKIKSVADELGMSPAAVTEELKIALVSLAECLEL